MASSSQRAPFSTGVTSVTDGHSAPSGSQVRADVLPADEIHADGDVVLLGESRGVAAEDHLVGLDEARGADDAQRRAGLDRQAWRFDLRPLDGRRRTRPPGRQSGGCERGTGTEAERRAAAETCRVVVSSRYQAC
jgi:hypothetical protein